MSFSKFDPSPSKHFGMAPINVGPDSTTSMVPFGGSNAGSFASLESAIGEAARNASLMGGDNRQFYNPESQYLEQVYNMGPNLTTTDIIFLPNIFRIWTCTPDMMKFPFIREIFKTIPITRETAIIIGQAMDLATTNPILVGAQTGGPTFSISTSGKTATTLEIGYTHRHPHKFIKTPKGAWIAALFVYLSTFLFDQELDLMILGVLMAVTNTPYKAVQAGLRSEKISIRDLLEPFLDKFAIMNYNPNKALAGMAVDTETRNSMHRLPPPDVCLVHPKLANVEQGIYGPLGNFQQSGPDAMTMHEKAPESFVAYLGSRTQLHRFLFYRNSKTNDHALGQTATLGSFCYQKDDVDQVGIERLFFSSDKYEEVPLSKVIENIGDNFFVPDKDTGLRYVMSLEQLIAALKGSDSDTYEEQIQKKLLGNTIPKGKRVMDKLKSCLGVMHKPDGSPCKHIFEISEKELPFNRVCRWIEQMRKKGKHVRNLLIMPSGGGGGGSGGSGSGTLVDEVFDFKGKKLSMSTIIWEFFQNYVRNVFDENDSNDQKDLETMLQSALNSKVLVEIVQHVANDHFAGTDFNPASIAMTDFFNNSAFAGTASYLDFLREFQGGNGNNLDSSNAKENFFRKIWVNTTTYPPVFQSGGGTPPSQSLSLASKISNHIQRKIDKIVDSTIKQDLETFYSQSTDYDNLQAMHASGVVLPWKAVVTAPFITYAGYAVAFAIKGEKTGYVGMTNADLVSSYQEQLEHIYHLYCKVFIMVEAQEAISRYDMVFVDSIVKPDYNTFLLLGHTHPDDEENKKYQWKSNPLDNEGHLLCFFESWERTPSPITSIFGHFFTPKNFFPPELLRENSAYHFSMSPLFLLRMDDLYRGVGKSRELNLFDRTQSFAGIPLILFQENSRSVFENGETREYKDSALWPPGMGPGLRKVREGKMPPPLSVTSDKGM